ncbi:hypothetical protein FHX82_006374 [Amycolatopsis bartoniae]|uniref:DUF2867 domain-containing protein n=1 Tax=Amycolatopsis bartoniae TaxID=941986 RepID=A0A8H9IQ97_9PSEU|nr:hypothetical protein [Amycolatopsis bartoniae]MBB2939288.1 hypothetical protein [Amycolatopsis bartoniae]TVT08744.1 hypothetical protein FNH07_11510 [Amycolatopsis bartoniae]GHF37560.1 hypothetical protein GCM10017566_08430 [Amycolatopsis bartoniae]
MLDHYAPDGDFGFAEHLLVTAPPAATYAVAGQVRGGDLRSPALRALTWARGLPVRLRPYEDVPAFEEILLGARWVLLGERPGRELVLGAAGRFWTPTPRWDDVTRDGFRTYARPRSGTVALAFRVLPCDRDQSLLTFETRLTVRDAVARRWAEVYWHRVKPAARLVARQILHAVHAEATSGVARRSRCRG